MLNPSHDEFCCRMAEELMPFLDHSIHDPAASRLAAGLKRKKPSVKDMSQHVSG